MTGNGGMAGGAREPDAARTLSSRRLSPFT